MDLGPPAAWSGAPAPIPAKAGPMPADHGLWFHQGQNIGPAWLHLPQGEPEATIKAVQLRSRPLAFEHGDLLPKRENLHSGIGVRPEEHTECGQEGEKQVGHESIVVISCHASTQSVASC
jgi:hypothetical protein